MAEIIQNGGTWTFDGGLLRLVPGRGRGVHQLRTGLGEVAVPVEALSGISFEAGRKGGLLRVRLRTGADPLNRATGGRLTGAADPYCLQVEKDRAGVAEYLVDEVRNAMLLEQVPTDRPTDRYLLPGPSVPLTLNGSDGKATFDGEQVRIDWGWGAEESKKSGGARTLLLRDLAGIEWSKPGWESGWVRFTPKGPGVAAVKPDHDPNCVVLWGFREARETAESALFAAAVTARLPHPHGPVAVEAAPGAGGAAADRAVPVVPPAGEPAAAGGAGPSDGSDHDALLRRLRELGELHRSGVLTDEEFATAKRSLLERF